MIPNRRAAQLSRRSQCLLLAPGRVSLPVSAQGAAVFFFKG